MESSSLAFTFFAAKQKFLPKNYKLGQILYIYRMLLSVFLLFGSFLHKKDIVSQKAWKYAFDRAARHYIPLL